MEYIPLSSTETWQQFSDAGPVTLTDISVPGGAPVQFTVKFLLSGTFNILVSASTMKHFDAVLSKTLAKRNCVRYAIMDKLSTLPFTNASGLNKCFIPNLVVAIPNASVTFSILLSGLKEI